ncbi:MAG: ArgE/DapE family deacylase [Desulfobacterales bacterium]|jgi:acetylornithine deacetylase|nr:ArgE/DapE family deacylase [Deltaproteobacteria bacterium]
MENFIPADRINRTALISLMQALIRINSVNPLLSSEGVGEADICRYIGDYLKKLGLTVRYQEIQKNRVNVIGILKGTGRGPTLMLNGHTDTVSVENMTVDPFDARIKEGKLYGRGALDMKAGVAAQISAIQTLIESGIKLKGDVILALVADEEYASIGTEAVVNEYRADAAIICEPTDLKIVIAHKGFAWIKIDIFGRAAHGSLPHRGIDAIVKAGNLLTAIETYAQKDLTRKTHPLLGSPSIHASLIKGGTELSTYPDYCKVELERRNLPGEDRRMVTQEMQRLLREIHARDNQFKADVDVFFFRPAFEISPDQPIVQTVSTAFESTCNRVPTFGGIWAWLDSAILAQAGIPAVIFGPSGDGQHAAVEYVDMESVVTTTKVLVQTITDFCNP